MKNKKLMGILTAGIMISSLVSNSLAIENSDENIFVEGTKINLAGVKQDGFNFFRIRDVAEALKNTNAKFDISYDQKKRAVVIETGKDYKPVKIENPKITSKAVKDDVVIEVDKSLTHLEVVNVEGYNYFRLRDLGVIVGFQVEYEKETKSVKIVPLENRYADSEKDMKNRVEALKDSKTPIIYGRDNCPTCLKLKKYLDSRNIKYEYRTTEDLKNKEEFIEMGFSSIPQMFYSGRVYSGFSEDILNVLFK